MNGVDIRLNPQTEDIHLIDRHTGAEVKCPMREALEMLAELQRVVQEWPERRWRESLHDAAVEAQQRASIERRKR